MWTHTITNKDPKDPNGLNVDVTYTDGVEIRVKRYYPSNLEDLKRSIKSQIEAYERTETLDPQVVLGVLDLTPAPPTQSEIERKQFKDDYERYWVLQKAVTYGLMQKTDAQIVALGSKIQTDYKDEYLEIIQQYA